MPFLFPPLLLGAPSLLQVQKGHNVAQGKVHRDAVSLEFSQADLGDGLAEAVLVKAHARWEGGVDVSLPGVTLYTTCLKDSCDILT